MRLSTAAITPHSSANSSTGIWTCVVRANSSATANAAVCSSNASMAGGSLAISACNLPLQTGFDFHAFCLAQQPLYQREREIHCGARSARGDELAVFHDCGVLLLYLRKGIQRAGKAGRTSAIEQSGNRQHRRCSA